MKKLREETKTILLKNGEMAVIACTQGRICDNIHLHGDDMFQVTLKISKDYYDDETFRSYIYLYINDRYTATFYGYELENIIE